MKTLLVDTNIFRDLAYRLLDEISGSGRTYRAVICPLRGGFYLSYFMSRHLDLPMEYICVKSYENRDRKEISVGFRPDLEEGPYLMCDDIYDSGRTVVMIHSLYPAAVIDTACLVSKVKDAPVYFGRLVRPEVWVNFFWEVM